MVNFRTMQKVYFLSDVHLGAEPPAKEQQRVERLLAFLDRIQEDARALYLVGDLFDYWFEYRRAIPRTELRVLFKLHDLVQSGIAVHYFTGNHDLWLGDYLAEQVGFQLLRRPKVVAENGLRLYLAHGDGLIARDRRIRWLNRLFQNRVCIFLYRLLHPDVGLALMRWVARRSRQRGENPFDREYREFARRQLRQGVDAVVLGHTHKPLFERLDSKYYINLGDWIVHYTYLELEGRTLSLKIWPSEQLYRPRASKLPEASSVKT